MVNTVQRNYTMVIACISDNFHDESIITEAFKTSKKYGSAWKVINFKQSAKPRSENPTLKKILKKAEILGAEVVNLDASSIGQGIVDYVENLDSKDKDILFLTRQEDEITLPILSKRISNAKVKQTLNSKNIEINFITADRENRVNYPIILPIFNYNALSGILETVIYILVASLVSLIFFSAQPSILYKSGMADLYLIYLIACVLSAFRAGMFAGIISAIISIITINFLFVQPQLSFNIAKHNDIIDITIFLCCAVIVSLVSSGSRRYILDAKQKEAYLNALLNISETLNRPLHENEALVYIYNELKKLFSSDLAFYGHSLMKGDILSLKYPEIQPEFNEIELKAFKKCESEFVSTGYLTKNFPASKWYFEPMFSSSGFKGMLAIKLADSPLRFDKNVTNIVLSFGDLSATIIDRIESTLSLQEDKILQEKEQLRTMILSSVSHDLKTPLASIIGSLDVYESLNSKLSEENKKTLLSTAHQEAVRLDNFITNILDMAKLESGSVKINKNWVSLSSIIDKAIVTTSPRFKQRQIFNEVSKDDVEIKVEPTLITRAIVNVLDNMSKYTPPNSNVFIQTAIIDDAINLMISDEGPGIEEKMLDEIFNKYTRIKQQDNKIAGTGLGLPIARFILRAHGGNIAASNQEVGMTFTLTFPEFTTK